MNQINTLVLGIDIYWLHFYFLLHERPLKNSDISLMDDMPTEWGEDEPTDATRFKVQRKLCFSSRKPTMIILGKSLTSWRSVGVSAV